MTRWAMVADLRRCVGCQTCTASCKHTNATVPGVQWRKVLDLESGTFPNVQRTFIPVGCQHCADPPCMHVCPSTATKQRPDGIVTIDYDLCIGCAYCAVACPYQARFKVDKPLFAYGPGKRMANEAQREDPARRGVAQKCTFCTDRIDYGLSHGLTPGVDPVATPACVNSCIADALHFGDAEDPESPVSKLLAETRYFRMHDEVGTNPGFHYVWAAATEENPAGETLSEAERAEPVDKSGESGATRGVAPWHQAHWDARAAGNFTFGGTGSGLMVAAGIAALFGSPMLVYGAAALALVGLGLFLVWLETGRPLRAPFNVFVNPQTSWMTRESMVAGPLFVFGAAAAWFSGPVLVPFAAIFAAAFLYCQARLVNASRGIPAWRDPASVPLLVVTGLAEGVGAFLLLAPWAAPGLPAGARTAAAIVLVALVVLRAWAWFTYRRNVAADAPVKAVEALTGLNPWFIGLGVVVPVVAVAAMFVASDFAVTVAAIAGFTAMVAGWMFKFTLILRAGYNQGFAIVRAPERGVIGSGGAGAKPGWS